MTLVDQISEKKLKELISSSHSFYQVLKEIGYKQIYSKKSTELVKQKCDFYNIDYSHLREDRFLEEIECKICGIKQPYSNFSNNPNSNGKIHHICANCKKKYHNNVYDNNINELNNYKAQLGCKKCGEKRFYLLDFHHKNPEEKKFTISHRANTSLLTLKSEIDKCIILCSNCHREFHYLNQLDNNLTLEDYLNH